MKVEQYRRPRGAVGVGLGFVALGVLLAVVLDPTAEGPGGLPVWVGVVVVVGGGLLTCGLAVRQLRAQRRG